MSIEPWLLELLVCPHTKVPLRELKPKSVRALNEMIVDGSLAYVSGLPVEYPLDGALMTVDKQTLYAVRNNIPVLLIEEAIPAEQASSIFSDCES